MARTIFLAGLVGWIVIVSLVVGIAWLNRQSIPPSSTSPQTAHHETLGDKLGATAHN